MHGETTVSIFIIHKRTHYHKVINHTVSYTHAHYINVQWSLMIDHHIENLKQIVGNYGMADSGRILPTGVLRFNFLLAGVCISPSSWCFGGEATAPLRRTRDLNLSRGTLSPPRRAPPPNRGSVLYISPCKSSLDAGASQRACSHCSHCCNHCCCQYCSHSSRSRCSRTNVCHCHWLRHKWRRRTVTALIPWR